jgi:mutual gliding-motility protein MglA
MVINQASKQVQLKIVYYGPALCGKTTNLEKVHANIAATQEKGKLVSLATQSDRTLFFDFLPVEAMAIKGYKTKFQLYTVPGQVIYNTTRQLVLRGVDGIIFVADSNIDKMQENVESFANLEENLRGANVKLADVPFGGRAVCASVQQARFAECGARRIHGLPAEQPRSASSRFRGLRGVAEGGRGL